MLSPNPPIISLSHTHTHTCTQKALNSLTDAVKSRLSSHAHQLSQLGLEPQAELLQHQLDSITTFGHKAAQDDPSVLQNAARDFAFSLAHIFTGALLIEHAAASGSTPNDKVAAKKWCSRQIPLEEVVNYSKSESNSDMLLVMDGYGLDQRSKGNK